MERGIHMRASYADTHGGKATYCILDMQTSLGVRSNTSYLVQVIGLQYIFHTLFGELETSARRT